MPDDAGLHDRDWYAWTQDQAARLRAWPEHLRPNGLDVELLAEEVEELGGSQRRAVESLLRQVVIHCLKLEFHPAEEARAHWMREIDGFRAQVETEFRDSPSLRARRGTLFGQAWDKGLRIVRRELEREAPEAARAFAVAVPAEGPPRYDLDAQVLNEDWYPAPPAP
ncbi:DUF29 domain-containing protein [Paracraurococcus lichenis]|uniref:DUF29 domain-containing protein n=1 Tax=Paracraurococcus lichenis TaxID=3064888 RepID=A0ABT9DWC5_9PROT|nr:DUF29 domain-containing protein [Paracraurococcus sp. LOR1-02]MDO9708199.1 DUF29 domain-containing protein [Paracraurococcus sp. LOR1-02]